jgi:hypothetical protein
MTALVWDKTGERVYQTGVDRGVLFLQDGTVVPWNGLTSVEDTTSRDANEFFLDGVKYLEYLNPNDFSANLKAFTYPVEFDSVVGIKKDSSGLRIHDQPSKSFSLSYRTKIGNDLIGIDAAYYIHLIYNVLANPDSHDSPTINDSVSATEFGWVLSARPVQNAGVWRPTAHVSVDSRDLAPEVLQGFEDTIYGTAESDPSLPALVDLPTLLLGF